MRSLLINLENQEVEHTTNLVTCAVAGLIMVIFVKKLKKLTHGADDVKEEQAIIEPE